MKYCILILIVSSGWIACKHKVKDPCAHSFDQTALLTNLGNNIIVPFYSDYQQKISSLVPHIQAFIQQPTASTLDSARSYFQAAYLSWQQVALFDFGPAETHQLRTTLNSYPVFVDRLNLTIAAGGTFNLRDPQLAFARGLPAVDYLLYGVGASTNEVLTKYTTDSLATLRQQYLQAVVTHIQEKTDSVVDAWLPSKGNYVATFINNTGVATGTSISLLINQLCANYEDIKNRKVGTPIGAKVSYVPSPNKVEAYYSNTSLELLKKSVQTSRAVYLGEANGTNGSGLDDYLLAAEPNPSGQPLYQLITSQFDIALQKIDSLETYSTLYNAINTDLIAVKSVYAAIQNQLLHIKTDMPALLCVSITYIDNTDDSD